MAWGLIALWYVTIGVLAAGGSIAFTSKHFAPRREQLLYGLLLAPIAAIYLAFLSQLSPTASFRAELGPIAVFTIVGLVGTRVGPVLMAGYLGHGVWDLAHEVLMQQGRLGTLTSIPLAYGMFCAAFDWAMVAYFWTRRHVWMAAWRGH